MRCCRALLQLESGQQFAGNYRARAPDFAPVLKFFSGKLPIRAITLPMIREYRQQRRQHISKNMKQPVTGRTVNYEMHLLRGMMIFADCWTDSLAARYTPLRHIKKRAGKVAEKVQLMDIIKKAKENDYWRLAMYCAVVAVGSGCRGGEIRNLQLKVFGNLTPHHDFASVELNILGTPECSRSEVRESFEFSSGRGRDFTISIPWLLHLIGNTS